MSQRSSPATLSGPSLFRQCADHPDSGDHWQEFVRRYNPLLVRSVAMAWRKYGPSNLSLMEVAEDLLQDVYLAITNHHFGLLRNFRGTTEEEANAYLMRTAIHATIAFLRARRRLRRKADEISLDELIETEGEEGRLPVSLASRQQRLSENDLIELLERCFTGDNANRNILIFLLHFRDGFSTTEITSMSFTTMKVTSVNNLLGEMKKQLRKFLTEDVKTERK